MDFPSKKEVQDILRVEPQEFIPNEKTAIQVVNAFVAGRLLSVDGHMIVHYDNRNGKYARQLYVNEQLICHREDNEIYFSQDFRDDCGLDNYFNTVADIVCACFNLDSREAIQAADGIEIIPERNQKNWEAVLALARTLNQAGNTQAVVTACPGTYEHFIEVLPPRAFSRNKVLNCPSHICPATDATAFVAVYKNNKGTEFLQYASRKTYEAFPLELLPTF